MPKDKAGRTTYTVECQWCQKPMTKASIWRHEKDCEENPDRGEPQHKCEKCGRMFRRRDSMVRHQGKRELGVCPPPRSTPSTPAMSGPTSPPPTPAFGSPATCPAQDDPAHVLLTFDYIMRPVTEYRLSNYSSLSGALLEDARI